MWEELEFGKKNECLAVMLKLKEASIKMVWREGMLKRKQNELTSFSSINTALVKLLMPITLKVVYQEVVREAVKLVDALYGTIFLYNGRKKRFERVYTTVPRSQWYAPRVGGTTDWVYKHNKPRLVLRKELAKHHPQIDKEVHSVIMIPLSFRKKKLGVLSIKSSFREPFNKDDLEVLSLFGTIASLSIRNAQLYKQKKEALEMRDLFVSVASHEFKTPLTSIKGYAQFVDKKLQEGKKVPEKMVKAIVRNADRLTEMINSLFMVSQIRAGTFTTNKRKMDFVKMVKRCVEDIRITSKREIRYFEELGTLPFYGDEMRLSSMILNLLRNAIKYSASDTPVEMWVEQKGEEVKVTVVDQGEGIGKKDLGNIFKMYFRREKKKPGLGLGLFLCREIAKAHGGRIAIKSQPGKGTAVTVVLPIITK